MSLNISALPQIPDVFFWWPMVADSQNELWLSHIRSQLSLISPQCVVVIAFDHQWAPDMENREKMLAKYHDAVEHIIDFDEGTETRMSGKFSLIHFHLS